MIQLPEGGSFEELDLAAHIRDSGRNYIIQGQTACTRQDHPKVNSLDYWLRGHAEESNTKQASNAVMASLVATRMFAESDNLLCPDSGRMCKGLILVE